MKPEMARVPGAGIIEVQASDTREIEVDSRSREADRRRADRRRRLGRAQGAEHDAAGRTVPGIRTAAPGAGVGALEERRSDRAGAGQGQERRDDPRLAISAPSRAARRIGRCSSPATDATRSSMSIAQQIGANILDLKAGVDGALASLGEALPAGIKISRVYDLAEFVEESIASVRDAILIGGFLAIVVLLVFLRDWRLTMIAAVTLPMAVIPTFVFMWLFGGTINLMSMGGLAVAIGLVIDDAVVVVENIHRRAGEGGSSVVDAVQQLLAPLVSSTLTTVVVFAPLGLLSGVPGQFFRALSLSLSVAVLISLALSISVVPLMARLGRDPPSARPANRTAASIARTAGCSA